MNLHMLLQDADLISNIRYDHKMAGISVEKGGKLYDADQSKKNNLIDPLEISTCSLIAISECMLPAKFMSTNCFHWMPQNNMMIIQQRFS